MSDSHVSIPALISLTLLATAAVAGCGPEPIDDTIADDDAGSTSETVTTVATDPTGSTNDDFSCPEPVIYDVDVNEWDLTQEDFVMMTELAAQHELVWGALDEDQQCRLACAFASDYLDPFFNMYSYSYSYDRFTTESCTLMLTIDQELITGGTVTCTGDAIFEDPCIGGRRPLAWLPELSVVTRPEHLLAGMATMEHVSITAFEELAAQLEELGAPDRLIARCRAAVDDERRHVELLVGLGAAAPECELEPAAPATSRLEIALHNAREGCVTETWAALLARYQSEHAADPATRRAFAEIARDEASHAQLAWDLHAWLCAGLAPGERAQVEAARRERLDALATTALSQALAVPADLRSALGLPDPRQARALAAEFSGRLAAAA